MRRNDILTGWTMKRTSLMALPLLLIAAAALAHGGATGIVKERMDQMGAVSKAMKAIGAMLKGAESYDAERVRTLANEIGEMGGERLVALFPENSLDPPTEARPEIWSDWERFERQANEMQDAARALAGAADGPRGDTSPASPDQMFRTLGGTCKACHESFRIKK